MTTSEYDTYEGRIEFFDSRTEMAVFANEAAHLAHEGPRERLPMLLQQIAMLRGSPIVCLGESDIHRQFPKGHSRRIEADQLVFLNPAALDQVGLFFLTAGDEEPKPDVVLEVDNTTDTRRNRVILYEAWGFPEVWVEVPSAYAPSRPRGLRSGLRIYLMEEGGYVPAEESRALPTWRAEEIHRALNERTSSERTLKVLERVARALGGMEGTGPEDDPILSRQRNAARAGERAVTVRVLLEARGIAVPESFLSASQRKLLGAAPTASVLAAAQGAGDFADFVFRLRKES